MRQKITPISQRIWTRGAFELLVGDSTGDNSGGGLFSRTLAPDPVFCDTSGNNAGGDLFGLGCIPDRPDFRDHSFDILTKAASPRQRPTKHVAALVNSRRPSQSLPNEVDLREYGDFGPIHNQGAFQSCASHVVTSMATYHSSISKAAKKPLLSRLFLYKVSREMLGIHGDRGCTLRETFKSLARYGCVEENRWPYSVAWVERLPRVPDFEQARLHRSFNYCRLDTYNSSGDTTLRNVLHTLADGFPVGFGFSIYTSIDSMGSDAVVPPPTTDSTLIGSHAVLAIGYKLGNKKKSSGGHLLIRNSWGDTWGKNGCAWLPFSYVSQQLACDFWAGYKPA